MTEAELRWRHPRRSKALEFIKSEIASGYPFPSLDAIGYHMGYRDNRQAHDVLTGLAADGFIERFEASIKGKRYAYRLKEMAE